MPVWTDCWDRPIRISRERLAHLIDQHPEMRGEEPHIAETLADPDVVVRSQSDPDVRLYHRSYRSPIVGNKLLCAVVKYSRSDSFLLTAYFTERVKRGALLWTRK